METVDLLSVLAVALYVVAALLALAALLGFRPKGEAPAIVVMMGGGLILAGVLFLRMEKLSGMPVFSRFDAMAAYALAITVAYGAWSACRFTRGIGGILIPYAALLLLYGTNSVGERGLPEVPQQGITLLFHVVAAYGAFGLFTLASLGAVAYLIQDGNLKQKRFGMLWEHLPSLETLDHLMSRLVGVAFLCLTISIVLGFVLIQRIGGGHEWLFDPKTLATVVLWGAMAVFVHLRASSDRHGRGIAMVAVFGLGCLFFAFLGVHLVAPSLHHFITLGGVAGS